MQFPSARFFSTLAVRSLVFTSLAQALRINIFNTLMFPARVNLYKIGLLLPKFPVKDLAFYKALWKQTRLWCLEQSITPGQAAGLEPCLSPAWPGQGTLMW